MVKARRGFTLIELMIALVLFSFVIAGVLAVAVSMSQGFREQRASVQAESAVRIPLDFMADAIRQASPGAPTNYVYDSYACTGLGLQVYNNSASPTGPNGITPGTDKLDVVYASGAVITSTREVYNNNSTLQVTDATGISAGDSIVITDTAQAVLVKVTAVNTNTLTLQALNAACPATGIADLPVATQAIIAGPYPAASLVLRVQHARFWVGVIDTFPTLMMDPDGNDATADWEPLAEGVEDLQLVKGVDLAADGLGAENAAVANGDEWRFNNALDTDNTLVGSLRAIRITMIARTTSGLIGNLKSFNRPAAEDHAAAPANSDNYRRRTLKTLVEVRNMSVSP
jgi:prepilin-type N-terminal cleavage/methylation domain-containing protein